MHGGSLSSITRSLGRRLSLLSLSADYYLFLWIFVTATTVFCGMKYYDTKDKYMASQEQAMSISAIKIEDETRSILAEASNVLKFLGQNIVEQKQNSEDILATILDNIYIPQQLNIRIMATSYVSWANQSGTIIVSGKDGILSKDFPDITRRKYVVTAKDFPWTLQTSPMDTSLFANEGRVLPTAMGIVDKHNKFMGYLILGLRLNQLIPSLEKAVVSQNIKFIFVEEGTSTITFVSNDDIITRNATNEEMESIHLQELLHLDGAIYSIYRKIPNYPYIIITGYDNRHVNEELHRYIMPQLYGYLLVVVFSITFTLFFRYTFVNPVSKLAHYAELLLHKAHITNNIPKPVSIELRHLAKCLLMIKRAFQKEENYKIKLEHAQHIAHTSDLAKENFIRKLNHDFRTSITKIHTYTNLLNDIFTEKSTKNTSIDKAIANCILEIQNALFDIEYSTSTSLHITNCNLQSIIQESIRINAKNAAKQNITVIESLNTDTNIFADELKIQQIFVGIIAESISVSPQNSSIHLTSSVIEQNSTSYIQISIQDNGIVLNEQDKLDIIKRSGIFQSVNPHHNEHEFDIFFIKKVVELHNGYYQKHCSKKDGNITTITLPRLLNKKYLLSTPSNDA